MLFIFSNNFERAHNLNNRQCKLDKIDLTFLVMSCLFYCRSTSICLKCSTLGLHCTAKLANIPLLKLLKWCKTFLKNIYECISIINLYLKADINNYSFISKIVVFVDKYPHIFLEWKTLPQARPLGWRSGEQRSCIYRSYTEKSACGTTLLLFL